MAKLALINREESAANWWPSTPKRAALEAIIDNVSLSEARALRSPSEAAGPAATPARPVCATDAN